MSLILTIGHSDHSAAQFVRFLQQQGVTAVGDVRSSPYSKHCPWFSRVALQEVLRAEGIGYGFLGEQLGARRAEQSVYIADRADYGRIAALPIFAEGITRLLRGAERQQVAIMCSERDPLTCHRTILVGRALLAQGATLAHIRHDGSVELGAEAEARLLSEEGGNDLFAGIDHGAALARAYDRRGEKVAYHRS